MNVSEALIREIVTKVLEESAGKGSKPEFEKHIDPSGIIGIKTSTVKCEPFQQDGVKLKDVVTLEEAPRMGCGIMELDHTSFEWTLTYDEYDLVLDGTLEIEIDGRVVSGGPGDIIYIPKGKPHSLPDPQPDPLRLLCLPCRLAVRAWRCQAVPPLPAPAGKGGKWLDMGRKRDYNLPIQWNTEWYTGAPPPGDAEKGSGCESRTMPLLYWWSGSYRSLGLCPGKARTALDA